MCGLESMHTLLAEFQGDLSAENGHNMTMHNIFLASWDI